VEIPVAEQPAPEETEPVTEPVTEETEPATEATEPVTEETEPVPEVTEPVTEETEPVEKIESAPVQKAETEEPAIIAQGTCGTNATWVFYDNDSLVISGTGAMDDYSESNPAPWNTWNDMIRTVKISDGITKVGAYSFNEECSRMYTLDLGSTVSVVGEYAFYGVPIFDLTLPDSVVSLGDYAFCGGGPHSIDRDVSIGSGLAEMGECAL
jgi:hypothetical protein